MRLPVKAGHLPQRIAAGAFILNSGIGKLSADEETAAQLHGFAAGAYPFLAKLKPGTSSGSWRRARSRSARRCCCPSSRPPSRARGWRRSPAACSACTPGRPACARKAAPSRPSRESPLAKDAWMMGIGLGLVIDDLTDRRARASDPLACCLARRPAARHRYPVQVAGQHHLAAERRRGLPGQPLAVPGLVALREMGEHEQPRPDCAAIWPACPAVRCP